MDSLLLAFPARPVASPLDSLPAVALLLALTLLLAVNDYVWWPTQHYLLRCPATQHMTTSNTTNGCELVCDGGGSSLGRRKARFLPGKLEGFTVFFWRRLGIS